MWRVLWDEFSTAYKSIRANPGRRPASSAEWAAYWQTYGKEPFAKEPLDPPHLPELYSGAPWKHLPHQATWVAFVGLNPAVDANEVFPTVAYYQQNIERHQEVVDFFENRFDQGVRFARLNNTWDHNLTWNGYEALMRWAAERKGVATGTQALGQVAAVVDAIPWKFNSHRALMEPKWKPVLRQMEADAGNYLMWSLRELPQLGLIVSMGGGALRMVLRGIGTEAGEVSPQRVWRWRRPGRSDVHVIRGCSPVAGRQFLHDMPLLVDLIARYWRYPILGASVRGQNGSHVLS